MRKLIILGTKDTDQFWIVGYDVKDVEMPDELKKTIFLHRFFLNIENEKTYNRSLSAYADKLLWRWEKENGPLRDAY